MDGIGAKMETKPIRVIITTDDNEIEGSIHIKPGGYQSRVSDMMNMHDLQYIPVTDATIHYPSQPQREPREAHAVILRLDTIKMVIPLDDDVVPEVEPAPAPGGGPAGGAPGGPWGGVPWGS